MFREGDAVVHPARGAGIVTHIVRRQAQEGNKLYYKIALQDGMGTYVMIPTKAVKRLGLRRAIGQSKLYQVWRVLTAKARELPSDHKERYKILEDKLHAGDIFQTAEVVRDLAGRQQRAGSLTTVGKRIYDRGMMLLAGEIAVTQSIELADAEAQIREKLRDSLSRPVVH